MAYNNLPRKRPLFNTNKADKPKRPSFIKRMNYVVKKALTRICIVIGALFLISTTTSLILSTIILQTKDVSLPEKMVLVYKIKGDIPETPKKVTISNPLETQKALLPDIIRALNTAADDDRVKAVVFSLSEAGVGLTAIQELLPAIEKIKLSGKRTIVYSDTYAGGADFSRYYLASAFDEVWMQPVGQLNFSGLNVQLPFIKSTIEKYGIKAEFEKRKEYKSAMETFTEDEMTAPARENMESLIGDIYEEALKFVASERGLSLDELRKHVDKGLLLDKEAVEAGLIDTLGYGDQIITGLREEIGGSKDSKDAKFIQIDTYASASLIEQKNEAINPVEKKSKVAYVNVVGTIMPGESKVSYQGVPFGMGGPSAGAATISGAILEAAEDKEIEAIIVRVASPGGSPVASETIRRSIIRAKEEGKKVIVSMGAVAASGGYWISADADHILALPSTITGSIGAVGGKYDFSGLWENVGVKWDGFKLGQNASIWSMNKGFSETERERISAMMDDIYDNFTSIVANGRKLSPEKIENIARGRAWSGNQALEIGLVDELGGIEDTYARTAKMLGKPGKEALDIIVMPRPKTTIEQIFELLNQQAMAGAYGVEIMDVVNQYAGPAIHEMNVMSDPQNYMVYDAIEIK